MQNCYLHIITCVIVLFTFVSDASIQRVQNSEYDANMNGLQRYYISQSSNVEDPEYFSDSYFATTENKNIYSNKYDGILEQNYQNSEDITPRNYINFPPTNWIQVLSGPSQDRNHGTINLEIRTNAKRSAELKNISDLSTEKISLKDEDIDKKVKEMDLAENPDVLVALFINILKKKYPEKLVEMKEILDKMATSGELICVNENNLKLLEHNSPILDNFALNRAKMIPKMSMKTTIETSTQSSKSTINKNTTDENEILDNDEELEEEDEEDDHDLGSYYNSDDNSISHNDYNFMHTDLQDMKDTSMDLKDKQQNILIKNKQRKNKLKSIINSVLSTYKPFIMPTFSSGLSKKSTAFSLFNTNSAIKSDMNSTLSYLSPDKIITTEMDEVITIPENGNNKKVDKTKWKLQLQTLTRAHDEKTTGQIKPYSTEVLLPYGTQPIATATDRPLLLSYSTYIPQIEANTKVYYTSFTTMSDFPLKKVGTAAYLGKRKSKHKNKYKKIRFASESVHRHRKKYKGV